jgi:hypothetical protein
MKRLILAAALALTAMAQAEAAPIVRPAPGIWYQGTWTCTIAQADNQKLFMTLSLHTGRAAVRGYPYYGKVEYTQLRRAGGIRPTVAAFVGHGMSLSLRRSATEGVMTGSARTTYRNLQLTCSKS